MKKLFYALLIVSGLFLPPLAPQAATNNGAPLAYVVRLSGVISPATYDLVHRHLERAAERKAAVFIIEMHTPGGLYDSMQQMVQEIQASPVPVVTYVSPAGSHAASAGMYILYASHIAAMAPGTNTGAATPVQVGGEGEEKMPDTMKQKMVNDASAYIRTLAQLRGRNAEWAEKAVRNAATLTAAEALTVKAIDIVAADIPDLLKRIDGKPVKMGGGGTMKLATKDARIETFEADWRTDILSLIAHPTVAFLLMSIGSYGLIFEVTHPGAVFPGVAGAICLLLALFAMNVLPINHAGLMLMVLGICLMTAEAFTPAFGALGIGGAIAFAGGAVMLVDSVTPGFGVDPAAIAIITLSSLLFLSVVLGLAVKAQKKKPVTGPEELLGAAGEVLNWSGGKGEVRVTGEIWQATADGPYIFNPGDRIGVTRVDGLVLTVAPQNDTKERKD